MKKMKTTFDSNGLLLEACLDMPENVAEPCAGVVLCHPNPRYGGDMHNSIIMAVSWALNTRGIACLRYNSRGVGRSQGFFGGGGPEQEDALAAVSFLAEQKVVDAGRVGIMGYSFGGEIALPTGGKSDYVRAIAGVSPVIRPDAGVLTDCLKPKLIICGEADDMISAAQIIQETAKMSEPKTIKTFPGVDHFWWGYEEEVAELVAEFFAEALS